MPVTKVGIVYSTTQQVIRRIIHFDRVADTTDPRGWREMTPEEIASHDEEARINLQREAVHPKETFTTIPHAHYHAITSHKAIHDHLGLKGIPGLTDRHAVVDKGGKVVAVVHGDPEIDSHPHGRLVHHPHALAGDTIVNGVHRPKGRDSAAESDTAGP